MQKRTLMISIRSSCPYSIGLSCMSMSIADRGWWGQNSTFAARGEVLRQILWATQTCGSFNSSSGYVYVAASEMMGASDGEGCSTLW
jgi:hypothetical protein